ncbi:Rhamnogalacturonase B, N-terminal-domain-containing protein [Dactylonectria estremocensis]|uniref:rhamnogalacturonan endolyase n=1 Tax=Dactylonectria estremocensis TaxID=1079267 RepID=A0A9P9DPI1_9HYPO|nr:Rhamnogalacturonase B, N-terminal-domain-containing protein [Dactylonectria estremocensis]
MLIFTAIYALLFWPAAVAAAWGYTDTNGNYVIDSGADLIISVSKTTGDINSLKYKGQEFNGWGGKNTHVESGLGTSTVTIATVSTNVIKVTVVHGTLKHYIVMRYKNNNVYLFTNKADDSVSAMRFIVRIKSGIFSHASTDPDYYDSGSTYIEASDVSINSGSITKSKHYQGSTYGRTMDYDYIGRTTSSVGLFMIRSNHEKASGGPFFRSLLTRADTTGEDLYEIYYYNMGHTDAMRTGLQGPHVIAFTDGGAPSSSLYARNADWTWVDALALSGWTTWADRGYASGVGISNMKSGFAYTVGLSNSNAQYWGSAASSNGAWSIKKIIPGTYTLTVYKGELEVYTGSVTISKGAGTAVNTVKATDPADDTAIWRIGEWDGTPRGFLNFEDAKMKPTYMHPSDKRLSSWSPSNFIVGTSSTNSFPGYMWVDVNNAHLVYFKLTSAQLAASHKIRIGITEAYINGRPTIKVNDWSATTPAATNQAKTRSLTVGTYRGNNVKLEFTVPSSAFKQSTSEWQILTISIVTGSTGTGYLSGGVSFDSIDMLA